MDHFLPAGFFDVCPCFALQVGPAANLAAYMEKAKIQLFTVIRDQSRSLVAGRSEEDLLRRIPGLSNNMLWIFGHLVRTTDFLLLKLSGNEMNFPAELDPYFAKGSSPADWKTTEGWKDRLFEVEQQCQEKILAFLESADGDQPFSDPYRTSTGLVLGNVQDALQYNVVHEGIHLGQLQLYNKLL